MRGAYGALHNGMVPGARQPARAQQKAPCLRGTRCWRWAVPPTHTPREMQQLPTGQGWLGRPGLRSACSALRHARQSAQQTQAYLHLALQLVDPSLVPQHLQPHTSHTYT